MTNLERQTRTEREPRRRGGLGEWFIIGGLIRHIRFISILLVVIFGSTAACAIFAPLAFRSVIDTIRNAGYNSYVLILGTRGQEALKVITYDVDVTAVGIVKRQMGGLLELAFGEGATVEGVVRVSLGADLKEKGFGVLGCDVDTSTIRTKVGRAPLAGTAFDQEKIEQQAYQVFKEEAAKVALQKHWTEAKRGLEAQFTTWALGLEVPNTPTLTVCPTFTPPAPN